MVSGKLYRRISSTIALVGGAAILTVALTSALTPANSSQALITAVGLSTGVGVTAGALMMLSENSRKARIGGALAVAFGLASIVAGAGLIIGLALSVLGGIIALLS